MTTLRKFKHRLLRHLPGRIGAKYARKHAINIAEQAFAEALHQTRGLVAIDLGANVGQITRRLAEHASHVHAFEPDPMTCKLLRDATSDLTNVSIVEAAAGIEAGRITLYRHHEFETDPRLHSISSSTVKNKKNVSCQMAIEVDLWDILHFLDSIEGEIGILKMDIEGAEVDILEKLFDRPDLMSKIRYIFAEMHEDSVPELRERSLRLRMRANAHPGTVVTLDWR